MLLGRVNYRECNIKANVAGFPRMTNILRRNIAVNFKKRSIAAKYFKKHKNTYVFSLEGATIDLYLCNKNLF
jgi:hypothetical protein